MFINVNRKSAEMRDSWNKQAIKRALRLLLAIRKKLYVVYSLKHKV